MGELILIIGTTGTGKSPLIRKYIENRKCMVYDINNEYGTRTKYGGQVPVGLSTDTKQERSRYIELRHENYIKICMSKTDTVCVFEDATSFFRGSLSQETQLMVTRKLFNRNNYIFVFHSINRVPPFLMELSNWVVLFRTNDQENAVKQKYASIYHEFLEIKNGSAQPIYIQISQ